MSLIPGVDSSAAALNAERVRLNVIATNIANANTTRDAEGRVYRRQQVVFESVLDEASNRMNGSSNTGETSSSVKVKEVVPDHRPLRTVQMPGHPDADANGIVTLPNVNVSEEMVDMITASRSIEANVQVINTAKSMVQRALEIGRR